MFFSRFFHRRRGHRGLSVASMTDSRPGLVSSRSAGNHTGWRRSWSRPMRVDPSSVGSFTAARMTDHNVRGGESDRKAG
jgi:hypothetical protein